MDGGPDSAKGNSVEMKHEKDEIIKEEDLKTRIGWLKEDQTPIVPGIRRTSAASGSASAPEAAGSRRDAHLSDSEKDAMMKFIETGSEDEVETVCVRLEAKKEQLS